MSPQLPDWLHRRRHRVAKARAVQQVRYEICQPTAAQQRADIEANKRKAEALRAKAQNTDTNREHR